jgi:hypothetical protein
MQDGGFNPDKIHDKLDEILKTASALDRKQYSHFYSFEEACAYFDTALVKSLTADFSFAISVFFFVGCFLDLDLDLLFDFDALALPPILPFFQFSILF